MEIERKCQETKEIVKAKGEKRDISDGNSKFPGGYRILATDCERKNCQFYKACKITGFDNLN